MSHSSSPEGLAKRSNVLGQILPSAWNTTQAHTLDGAGKQCHFCEDHALSPMGTLDTGMRLDKAYK